ncbi:GNAT family N-acetyltransferase [Paucibacter sp. APW11]|uniref:GNAT family N-acetyltransferase n=1 Tax=Roseateles aquae TaxID=3077235 RepID=A0ABU3PDG4_9BURK|nr:GNAT family N-acetyltransferase [Paucibacter sp. APW11]MDT9000634.1 GNAT family N-acetyltransferase [Paucibacter sp. APW11]
MTILHTARLRLEPMSDAHLDGLAEMNADPEVARYISGKPETREDTQSAIERVKAKWAEWGYSWWSFIELESGLVVGAGCVQHLGKDKANPHELGWRLRRDRWGRGYAIEAALEMARFAFEDLHAPLVQAVCVPANTASSAVMLKLGMHYVGLQTWYEQEMATYELQAAAWRAQRA